MKEIEIKTYSKGELALLYMPNVLQPTARRTMMGWIQKNAPLIAELYEAGYRDRAVLLTPKQVEIIFKYLGPP